MSDTQGPNAPKQRRYRTTFGTGQITLPNGDTFYTYDPQPPEDDGPWELLSTHLLDAPVSPHGYRHWMVWTWGEL